MMIVGVLLGAISDGATVLAVSLVHGSGVAHSVAVISFGGAGDYGICSARFGPTGCRTLVSVA